jgi:hypothetical protein
MQMMDRLADAVDESELPSADYSVEVPSAIFGTTTVTLQKGRIVFPGQRSTEQQRPEALWFSNGRQMPLSAMQDGHLWNTINKLNSGQLGRDRRGRHHPQWENLLEEAAARGLCLQRRPEFSGMRHALDALRGTPRRRLPATEEQDQEPRRRAVLRNVDLRTDPVTVRDDIIDEGGVVETGTAYRVEPAENIMEDDFRFDDRMDEAREMEQEMGRLINVDEVEEPGGPEDLIEPNWL